MSRTNQKHLNTLENAPMSARGENAKKRLKLKEGGQPNHFQLQGNDFALQQIQAMAATGSGDPDAAGRLLTQVINAQPDAENLSNANAAMAMLQGINPQDELEGMLAAQMVAVHNLSMEYASRAMRKDLGLNVSDSLINRTAKLMNVFTRQVEALNRYRNRGQQKITVQHVQIGQGGQAIIGDVHRGDARG